jgi:hypothetical protein
MNRRAILLLIMVLAVSSLIVVSAVFAQAIPKPSVPEFTIKLVAHPYDVPTTYEIDQNTGVNITYPGYHVENKSIEVTIKNQPLSSSLSSTNMLFYNIRYKNHFEDNWTEAFSYTHYPSENANDLFVGNLAHQSDSEYTAVTIPEKIFLIEGKIDFQAQAMTWHLESLYIDGRYQMCFTSYVTSEWSSTQTVLIEENQTPTPSPVITTPTPSPEPQQSEQFELFVSVITAFAVIGAGVGLLFYFKKHKH